MGKRDCGQGWGGSGTHGHVAQAGALGFPSLVVPRMGMVSSGEGKGALVSGEHVSAGSRVSEEDQE